MTLARAVDALLAAARTHAAAGEWNDVRLLLASHAPAARSHPELTTLRAESELRTGHPRDARAWLSDALPAVERSGDRAALRRAVNQLGVADVELGALDDAERAFEWALMLAQLDGDDLLVARATNNLGAIANIRGRRDEALALYQLAIPAYQRLGNVRGLAESYHNMAITYRDLGQLERADECERKAIEYAREAASGRLLALARLGRADLSFRAGDACLAEAGARRAATDFAGIRDPIREADALRLVGAASLAQGKHAAARAALDGAIQLARSHGSALIEAEALHARAELLAASGAVTAARTDAAAAAAIYGRLDATAERAAILEWMERAAPAHAAVIGKPTTGH